jgi:hypothetical protein
MVQSTIYDLVFEMVQFNLARDDREQRFCRTVSTIKSRAGAEYRVVAWLRG